METEFSLCKVMFEVRDRMMDNVKNAIFILIYQFYKLLELNFKICMIYS
jgi:hypothetical protein